MVAFNTDSLCREAEAHYFDFLPGGEPDGVPRHIIDHVRECRHCRARIERLGGILALARLRSEISQTNAAIGTMLKLHFAYLGQPVTCKTVKPFLPALLDPTLEIRIPTPIIVHLDHCQSCSEDLERIREMNLSRKQLCRLSQMYTDRPKDKYIACPKAQAAINPVVNLSLHETNADVLKHLCLCSYCRELVFEARKFTIRLLPESAKGGENFLCSQVSPCDIFDYAVPYGLDPSSDQYVKFRESLAAHVRKCPTCLVKIQELHQTLFGIIDRPESGVVTVCHTVESSVAKTPTDRHSDDLYSGFPIRVEVSGLQIAAAGKQPISPDVVTATTESRFSIKRLAPLATFGGVAAAVAIVAAFFLLSIPSAKAVTLEQIYEAILRVKNVYIASFTPGKTEPTQEKWVSRELGLYMTKTDTQSALWDISKGIRKSRRLDTSAIETERLKTDDASSINEKIAGSLGLIPFDNIPNIPSNAKWTEVIARPSETNEKGNEVYELVWSEKAYDGSTVIKKWRVFVQVQTKLPLKVEWYQKTASDEDFTLLRVTLVGYPSTAEIQNTVERICP